MLTPMVQRQISAKQEQANVDMYHGFQGEDLGSDWEDANLPQGGTDPSHLSCPDLRM